MDAGWLTGRLAEVGEACRRAVPEHLPELGRLVERGRAARPPAEALLPLAACRAVGGDPAAAVPVAAALGALELALRLLDDVRGADGLGRWSRLPAARARNLAVAAEALAHEVLAEAGWPAAVHHGVHRSFVDTVLAVTAGRDRALAAAAASVDDYLYTVELTTGAMFATACGCGAMVGADDDEQVAACTRVGHHLGVAVQVARELAALREPGLPDLVRGKATLPVVYALGRDHPGRVELRSIVEHGELAVRAEQVRGLLDAVDAAGFTARVARAAGADALAALMGCPEPAGRRALEACAEELLAGVAG